MRSVQFTLLALFFLVGGCAARQTAAPAIPATPPGAYQVLSAAAPVATETLRQTEQRSDIEVRPTHFDVTPAVVSKGETPEIVLGNDIRPSFAGNAEGTEGWHVDNILLVEVESGGAIIDRFIIGFLTGQVYQGSELLENVGEWSPRFGPRSPDLGLRLPRGRPIKLLVTALDNGNAGAVSDLFLILEKSEVIEHELRDGFWERGSGI